MRKIIPPMHNASKALITMIDADTNAFNDFVKALSLPKTTKEEQEYRNNKMQKGLKKAIEIPLSTMETADNAWDAMKETAEHGNIASKSDIEVGARALEMGIWGAYKNVIINMADIKDEQYRKKTLKVAENLKNRAEYMCSKILNILENR
jgi:glutamate formiminotransferase/formiminotetrahydrofolate cyclodeaminase